jgi:hypothetical protein
MAITYGSATTITFDFANLASSSTFVAGRECTQIDNTSDLFEDAILQGNLSVGTTPTAGTNIILFGWGAQQSLATTAIDVLDGTDSAETITNTGVLASFRPLAIITVLATTSDIAYPIVCPSVCARMGWKVLPPFWGFYAAHNTGVNSRNNAVNTNGLKYVGIKT